MNIEWNISVNNYKNLLKITFKPFQIWENNSGLWSENQQKESGLTWEINFLLKDVAIINMPYRLGRSCLVLASGDVGLRVRTSMTGWMRSGINVSKVDGHGVNFILQIKKCDSTICCSLFSVIHPYFE